MLKQEQRHACDSYTDLKLKFRDIGRLQAIGEVLERDFLTGMPDGAYRSRRNQIAYIKRLVHEQLACKALAKLLEVAQSHCHAQSHCWDEWDRANLREMIAMHKHYNILDPMLTDQLARAAQEGRRFHSQALKNGDWETARYQLQQVIDIQRRVADLRCKALNLSTPYEAMLELYAPGFSLSEVENWFAIIEKKLKVLLPKVIEKQAAEEPPIPLKGPFSPKAQMWINRELLRLLGFDFERGGLYETGHNPVEGGTPDDTRLVIKSVDSKNFMESMKSALHEGGHGLYIQGLPREEWRYQPVAQDLGAAMHESQALIVEMIIGRRPGFYDYIAPRMEGLFHSMGDPSLSAQNLHRLKLRVKPTPDRKRADEITYFFHILMRFRLEKALLEGRLSSGNLPNAWADMMEELLGVRPQTVAEGPLQDVHWFVGKFGYFPTYTLGHMGAAQMFRRIIRKVPDVRQCLSRGNFEPFVGWLHDNIHARGRLYSAPDLIENATGKPLSPQPLLEHLEKRYL